MDSLRQLGTSKGAAYAYSVLHVQTQYTHRCTNTCTQSHTHTHTHTAHTLAPIDNCIFCVAATMPPTIAEATDDTVDSSPMLTAGEVLTLTCTAMGTPRPQIDWYNSDRRITTSSRVQINKSEISNSTLVSTLAISSVTVGDSGTYECRVENDDGNTSLQYQVSVSECFYVHCGRHCLSVHMQIDVTHAIQTFGFFIHCYRIVVPLSQLGTLQLRSSINMLTHNNYSVFE